MRQCIFHKLKEVSVYKLCDVLSSQYPKDQVLQHTYHPLLRTNRFWGTLLSHVNKSPSQLYVNLTTCEWDSSRKETWLLEKVQTYTAIPTDAQMRHKSI